MEIQKQIQDLLDKIEHDNGVSIVLAIESGSRAWGFPSKDSDYDIRFIYHHKKDWYVSAFEQRDVIDTVFVGDLDAGGWDIKKCVQLMHKGNAPLLEWLHSPIIYRQREAKANKLRQLAIASFNPKPNFYHYLSLAKKKLLDEKTATHAKSYLYALRALLCAKWIAEFKTIPPVDFQILRNQFFRGHRLDDFLSSLLEDKINLSEGDKYPISAELLSFAEGELDRLKTLDICVEQPIAKEGFDAVFAHILLE